jgi:hypothetical protein
VSIQYSSALAIAVALMQRFAADELNRAAQSHLTWADFRVPVDKGNLRKTNRQTETATPEQLRAVVVTGGMTTEDGTVVDYAAAVNNGSHHVTENGTTYDIPANPYWTEAEEEGRKVTSGTDAQGRARAALSRSVKQRIVKRIYGPGEKPVYFQGGVGMVD